MSANRFVRVQSSLGEKALLFESMEASEALSAPFKFDLRVLSEDPDMDLGALLGEAMTVRVTLPDDSVREFSGLVASVALDGAVERLTRYTIVLRPWLWLLRHRADCRIHQGKTAVEIIKEIFNEHGFSDFEDALTQSYPTREYSVQYRESDLNYVSRLMEEEGIYYFFKYQAGKHILVLADGVSAHSSTPGYEEVPFYPPEQQRRERDHLEVWRASKQVRSAVYAATDFDFERPRAALLVRRQTNPSYQPFEVFDYPGDYFIADEGERLAQLRLEELQHEQQTAEGAGPIGGLAVGALFTLTNFQRQDQNREYLITSAQHSITEQPYESGAGSAAEVRSWVRAIDSREPFRPPRTTRRPVVEGPQTAIVVGKAGEEIWTDEHGRVKVQFHWDRYGNHDENSSCWVRVAQLWAGSGFGAQFLPRIGQEVIVEFLEGDPDRPLITGRVYNGDNPWPYTLPGDQTQSGIKTRSTKGGGASNANEIRFEDKKGSEQLYVQAEKNLDTLVKASESHSVGSDRSITVGNNETHDVGVNQTIDVGVDRSCTIGGNESLVVAGNQTTNIAGTDTLVVGGTQSVTVSGNVTESYGASKVETVAVKSDELVGGMKTVNVGAVYMENVGASRTIVAGGTINFSAALAGTFDAQSVKIEAGKNFANQAGQDYTVKAGKKLVMSAGDDVGVSGGKKGVLEFADQLTIKVGGAQITLKKNGDITIKGKKLTLKGSGPVSIKGSKVTNN